MTIIRTKTRVEGGITDEEKILLKAHSNMWIKRIMRTDEIESDKITPAIKALYVAADLAEPRVVVVQSPFLMALIGGFASAIWYQRDNNKEQQCAKLKSPNAVTDAITKAVNLATSDVIVNGTIKILDNDIKDIIHDVDWKQLAAHIVGDADFAFECVKLWYRQYQGGNMWGSYDCYLTAMRDVLGLDLEVYKKYKSWEDSAIHGGYRLMHDKFCIVSDFPELLKIDEESRPHCEDGPSHRWRDGFEIYHWHGVRIKKDWIMNKDGMDANEIINWRNTDERTAGCQILGWDKILDQLDPVIIHQDSNPYFGTLYEADLPDQGKQRFLKALCGTGNTIVVLISDMEAKTAREAGASTYGVSPEDYNPTKRT